MGPINSVKNAGPGFVKAGPTKSIQKRLLCWLAWSETICLVFPEHIIDVTEDVIFRQNGCTLKFSKLLKQSKPGRHQASLSLDYDANRDLRVVSNSQLYQDCTKNIRRVSVQGFFLSTIKPNGPAAKDTPSNWLRHVLGKTGLESFALHSIRAAAAASAAQREGVSINETLESCGWSNQSTFARFYKRQLINTGINNFQNAVWKN